MFQNRLQQALSILPPFDQLDRDLQKYISHLKTQFPYDNELSECLTRLGHGLEVLSPYIVWFPYENFVNMVKIGQGGFAAGRFNEDHGQVPMFNEVS